MTKKQYKIELGNYIKYKRNKLGFTQKELAEKIGISERHMVEIEKGSGKSPPHPYTLEKMLEFFGETIEEAHAFIFREERMRFNNYFEEILELIIDREFVEAKKKYDFLEKNTYYDKKIRRYKQALGYLDGVFAYQIDKELEKSFEILINSIKLTRPGMFVKKKKVYTNEFDISYIKDKIFTLVEYNILIVIAYRNEAMDLKCLAIEMMYNIIDSLNLEGINLSIRNRVLDLAYFNLSNLLLKENRNEEAIRICDKGIDFCKKIRTVRRLPKLQYNKGYALASIGEFEEAKNFFESSINSFLFSDDISSAEKVKEFVYKNFTIIV